MVWRPHTSSSPVHMYRKTFTCHDSVSQEPQEPGGAVGGVRVTKLFLAYNATAQVAQTFRFFFLPFFSSVVCASVEGCTGFSQQDNRHEVNEIECRNLTQS